MNFFLLSTGKKKKKKLWLPFMCFMCSTCMRMLIRLDHVSKLRLRFMDNELLQGGYLMGLSLGSSSAHGHGFCRSRWVATVRVASKWLLVQSFSTATCYSMLHAICFICDEWDKVKIKR